MAEYGGSVNPGAGAGAVRQAATMRVEKLERNSKAETGLRRPRYVNPVEKGQRWISKARQTPAVDYGKPRESKGPRPPRNPGEHGYRENYRQEVTT